MTAHVLVTGAIHRKPELRKAKNGKTFCTTKLKVSHGDDYEYWAVNAFDDAGIAVMNACDVNDLLSVTGKLIANVYHPDAGEARVNLTVSASHVISLSANARAAHNKAERLFKPKQQSLNFNRREPF